MDPEDRRPRLAEARLYFVCDAARTPEELDAILGQALASGVDVVQLRDKHAPRPALLAAAGLFRSAAAERDALFIVNDDPALAAECGADGVHIGQDDADVAAARAAAGEGAIVGLSTHGPDQLEAAERAPARDRPDYVSIGPVWETPTKPGRPAAGLEYVRHAAREATLPWFAIGGIDPGNVAEVAAAGAERIVVVRAIRDAPEPLEATRALREALEEAGVSH